MMQGSVLVAVVVLVAAGACAAGAPSDRSDGDHALKVSASASAEQFVATSLAEVSVSISVERKAVDAAENDSSAIGGTGLEEGLVQAAIDANAELARRAGQLIALLRAARVEKLRTTSARLDQVYEYLPNEPPRQIGVRAHEGLSFRTNLTLVGELLTSIVASGATSIEGVSFVAADADVERGTLTAIRQAVQKAKLRATVALQEAGCTGAIAVDSVSLNTPDGGYSGIPAPLPMAKSFAAADAAPRPLPVVGGESAISVQASVKACCLPGGRTPR